MSSLCSICKLGELARGGVQFSCMSSEALVTGRGRSWGETPMSGLLAHPSQAVATVAAISCILHATRKPLVI